MAKVTAALQVLRERVAEQFGDTGELCSAITCALPAILPASEHWREWLLASNDALCIELAEHLPAASSLVRDAADQVAHACGTGDESLLWHLYELLVANSSTARKASGTFYTPPAVARFLVAQVDRKLRQSQVRGLEEVACHLLEPACGSGVFLAALFTHLQTAHRLQPATAADLTSRLIGIDLSPVATALTRLRIALTLQAAGIALTRDFPQPQLIAANALAGPNEVPALSQPIGVVLGNPPFSYLSQNDQPWIQSLIRGGNQHAGYFSIDDQQLGEKKTWLHDDYVKFLRLAQWCIEQNGQGVVSFVTNHGWLDNATFRIARQQLIRTFTQIDAVDLHGNAKRHEANPSGERDENVFGIAQGVALVTLTKADVPASKVTRADLWGSRKSKLQQLTQSVSEPLSTSEIVPTAPWFTFAEQAKAVPPEYAAAPLLTELMPVNSTVPVTARDHFVVAATRDELQQRLAEFCDPQIRDDEIRRKYFQRTRSNRYEPGDTRGWKLPAVRRTLMNEADPARCIRRCLYRPFIWRFVMWHPALIDWPRTEFTRHFDGDNLALLARRQSVAGREANFFWITDALPLDGVIRSDNRGSESFFPLTLTSPEQTRWPQLNLASNACREFEPANMLSYVYGLFHSTTYRTRYAAALAMEFPRVLLPKSNSLFEKLSELGGQLIRIHRTDPLQTKILPNLDITQTAAIENFYVGTYNVCRKWLQMTGERRDSIAFAGLQQLICDTLQLQQQIEEAIAAEGGFPRAFD